MSLSDSKLLIRDYSDIRDILRDIYIFGCFSRDDFIKKGISGRKYDNEQRRIMSYLPEKFIKKKRVGKRVLPYCSYAMTEMPENFMAETYRNKSFTMLDFMSYFLVLAILNTNDGMSLAELLEVLPDENDEVIYTKDNLRKKIDELTEKGLVISEKKGRNVVYKVVEDSLAVFEDEELVDLYWLLEFMKNIVPLEMPFYFLQNKLKLYLFAERNIELDDIHPFQYKSNHLFNILDNEVIMKVLRAISEKKKVLVRYLYRGDEKEEIIIPIKIIHECTYSRQYLLYYRVNNECIRTKRIDKIVSVDIKATVEDLDLNRAYQEAEAMDNAWCVSNVGCIPDEVKIEFYINEETELYVLERIKREGKNGTLKKVESGVYLFTIKVSDPLEMTPWIRSFGERAKVVYSKDGSLQKHIIEDYERTIAKYESI